MTGPLVNEDCVVETRGDVVENTHRVHAAVVDADGRMLFAVGDPSRVTLMRSAAKPAQALAILETGAFDDCPGFEQADVALICASHNSEQRHIDRVRSILSMAEAHEDDLRCGGHASISPAVNRAWVRADFEPTPIYNNCSGKHAGMLAGARALGAPLAGYHLPQHQMQEWKKQTVQRLCREPVQWACDGCNLPAPACSLRTMAFMYAQFAAAADSVSAASQTTHRMARIFQAMASHPDMVAGQGRFCTTLMEAFDGALIGKVGADACYGIAIRPSVETRGLGTAGSIGIAIKVEDGNMDILYSTVVEILTRLDIGTATIRARLATFHAVKRVNTAGVEVGRTEFPFRLRPCSWGESQLA